MTDKKSNDSRRKLLKSIAVGSGAVVAGKSLPESWSKPIVDSVMLPAHAETTDDGGSDSAVVYSYWELNAEGTGVGSIGPPEGIHACISVTDDMATVTFQGSENNVRRSGTVSLNGTRGDAAVQATAPGCENKGKTKTILIVNHNPGISITFGVRGSFYGSSDNGEDDGYDVTIQQGTCATFPALDGSCNK